MTMNKLLIGADVLMAAVFAWRFMFLPAEIPLFYSRPWGEPQIVEYWYIGLLPIIMHIFYFGNRYIVRRFFSSEDFFQKLFRAANLFTITAFTVVFIKILFLVT